MLSRSSTTLLTFLASGLLLAGCGGNSKPAAGHRGKSLIAFGVLSRGMQTLYTIGADGSRLRRVSPRTSGDPAWSHDGSMISFAEIRKPLKQICDRCSDIYISAPDGSDRRRLTSNGDNFSPTWSADGR